MCSIENDCQKPLLFSDEKAEADIGKKKKEYNYVSLPFSS